MLDRGLSHWKSIDTDDPPGEMRYIILHKKAKHVSKLKYKISLHVFYMEISLNIEIKLFTINIFCAYLKLHRKNFYTHFQGHFLKKAGKKFFFFYFFKNSNL